MSQSIAMDSHRERGFTSDETLGRRVGRAQLSTWRGRRGGCTSGQRFPIS